MKTHLPADKQEASTSISNAQSFEPVRIVELEIGQPLPAIAAWDDKKGQCYQRALCLVRLHTQPLGTVELELEENGMQAQELAAHIWRVLETQINEHLQQDGLPAVTVLDAAGLASPGTPRCLEERDSFLAHAPFVSVIVPTHNRPERISACVRSLLALRYPHYEIIVVDNAPSSDAAAALIQQTYREMPQVRYVREDHPGASWARNCGMRAAKGEILAFVDDDVVIDAHWLTELAMAFSMVDDAACVTGHILPLELETPAQDWFEQYGGFSKGFTKRVFDMAENRPKSPLFPYTAGSFGSGANMAFRTEYLRVMGGFETTLENLASDIEAFYRVIISGYKLVYQPAALVYHPHQRDYQDLRKQIYRYGRGLTALLTKSMLDNPKLLLDLATKLPYGFFFLLSTRSPKNKKKRKDYPRDLTMSEVRGMLYGPFTYLRRRWAMRDGRKVFATGGGDLVQ
jgi:GT2 family glycosyltransferase